MELPSPLSLSSSFSSSPPPPNILTANALPKASCDQPTARSHTNLTCISDASNHHQFNQYVMIQLHDKQAAGSKKRKLTSSDQQEEEAVRVSTIHTMSSPQHKVGHQYCRNVSCTFKDDPPIVDKEEEGLGGCTTPPHVQSTTCNAAHHHYCKTRETNEQEELINEDLMEYTQTSASVSAIAGHNEVRCFKGDISIHNGSDHEGMQSIRVMCGCNRIRRGPPPPPRKPKAKPRILKSNHLLHFFVPPDLELFFSSTSSHDPPPINTYKQTQLSHDAP